MLEPTEITWLLKMLERFVKAVERVADQRLERVADSLERIAFSLELLCEIERNKT